jgi:prevent-host-death family protein
LFFPAKAVHDHVHATVYACATNDPFPTLTDMTIYSHNESMKKAKVSELKARLSSYLADVRNGDTLVVCDRATPIAWLVPIEGNAGDLKVCEPEKPIPDLKEIRPVRLRRRVDALKILKETRGWK